MDKQAYIEGVRFALKHAGVDESQDLPAELLAALLRSQEDVAKEVPEGESPEKDPKEPKDVGTWGNTGPFGGDTLTNLGLTGGFSGGI